MRDRVLAIVNLITQYILEDQGLVANEQEMVQELLEFGFEADEIDAAFTWMETQTLHEEHALSDRLDIPAQRIFTAQENLALTREARGFLVKLRSLGILDQDTQEEIIERAVDSADEPMGLQDIKQLAVLSLFSRAQHQWRKEVDCILDDDWSALFH